MAGKRPLKMVRAVGRLIVCSDPSHGDPRGVVVNQIVDARYVAADPWGPHPHRQGWSATGLAEQIRRARRRANT